MTMPLSDDKKFIEVNNYFRRRLEESKERRSRRGNLQSRTPRTGTWRQLSGINLMIHEVGHVGNRPFMIGIGTVACMTVWAQINFNNEDKKNSTYWTTFHAKNHVTEKTCVSHK